MLGTLNVVDDLRREGFCVNLGYVQYLLRERVVPMPEKAPGGALVWEPFHIDRLKAELRRRGRGPEETPR